jgi:hypothetical protein
MEEREELERDLERYRYLLANIRDDQAISALRQLVTEVRERLDHFEEDEPTAR